MVLVHRTLYKTRLESVYEIAVIPLAHASASPLRR